MKEKDDLGLYSHIILNEGAYFFKRNENVPITKKSILDLFENAGGEKEKSILTVLIRKRHEINAEDRITAYCSLLVFSFNSEPQFFNFSQGEFNKKLIEKKLAYLLIIEIGDYIVIFRKNVTGISSFIKEYLVPIESRKICAAMVDTYTKFQQLKLTNMNMDKSAIRNKMYEADDLENVMPMYGANRQIVNTIRFMSANDDLCSINISTSRIAKLGEKRNIDNLLLWLKTITESLDNDGLGDMTDFLSRFAMPTSWRSMKNALKPISLLIDVYQLQNYISFSDEYKFYITWKDSEGNEHNKECTNKAEKFIREYAFHDLEPSGENQEIFYTEKLKKRFGIKRSNNGIRIWADGLLRSVYVHKDNEKAEKLIDIINHLGCFSVGFDDYKYIYSSKNLYKNNSILSDFDAILSILEPYPELRGVTSEKGDPTTNSVEFDAGCIFNVVENRIFNNAEFIVCDDMGEEWADHIIINGSTVAFCHSKYKEAASLSASNFQDVLGQAVKNIGHLIPSDNILENKRERWRHTVRGTQIRLCRRGDVSGFINRFKELRVSPNFVKEVCLAINFISKAQLQNVFNKIKNNQELRPKANVIQLAWLLNAFISICKDVDMHCRIFCMP